jgi:hypothetical protein
MAGSMARSGQNSLAQGLPWVLPYNTYSPEGARSAHVTWLGASIAESNDPFRAHPDKGVNPGLSWPLRALGCQKHSFFIERHLTFEWM